MIFVIGGISSGKRDYVKKAYGFTNADIADAHLDDRPVLYNLQNLIAGKPEAVQTLAPLLLNKQVVICNEVGSGVVPIDKTERATREATGRICVELAEKADKVIRIVCGIPTVIKG